jgi:hypothetical protein
MARQEPPQSATGANSESPSSTGRRRPDAPPVSGDDRVELHGILLPAAQADARDKRPASGLAEGPPGQPCRQGRWRQSDAARQSSTSKRQRSSAAHFAPACRAWPRSCRLPHCRSAGNSFCRWSQAAEVAQSRCCLLESFRHWCNGQTPPNGSVRSRWLRNAHIPYKAPGTFSAPFLSRPMENNSSNSATSTRASQEA